MPDRGEHRKGPIVRYGRRGREQKGPVRHSDEDSSAPSLDATPPSPTPLTTPNPNPQPFAPPSRVRIRRRSSFGGAGVRLAVAAVFALIVIAAVAVPVSNLGSSIQIPTIATPVVPTTNAPSQHTIQTHHAQAASYLTASGLTAGLAHIGRVAPGARLSLVRVAGDSLIATARLPDGRIKQIVFEPTGTFVIGEPDPGERFLPMAQIRPSAVVRIVTALRTKFHVPASRIDYIVLSSPTGAPTQWIAFLKTPGHPGFTATLSGTRLTRLPG